MAAQDIFVLDDLGDLAGAERHDTIDVALRYLGLDPLDVRLRNLYGVAERNVTHYQMKVEDNILQPLIAQLERTCDYRRRRLAIAKWNAASPVIKRGIAITPVKFGISFTATHQYLDDNPTGTSSDSYTIGATVTDNQGGSGSNSAGLTVNNVAPVVAPIGGPAPSPGAEGMWSAATKSGSPGYSSQIWDVVDVL